jgi:hypothetical protein
MRAAEIRDAVLASRPLLWSGHPLTSKKVTEILRNQARGSRVHRVRHGVWIAPREGFPKTTRWRYENWERAWDAAIAARRRWEREWGCEPGSA